MPSEFAMGQWTSEAELKVAYIPTFLLEEFSH